MERGLTTVLIAPTMHGSLHNSLLVDALRRLHDLGARVIPPRDAYGKHNLPEDSTLVAEVCRAVRRSSLRKRPILVAGGAPPVPISPTSRLVAQAPAGLGVAIARELHLRGADAMLVQPEACPPDAGFLPSRSAPTYEAFQSVVRDELARGVAAAVFCAAFADRALVETSCEAQSGTPTPRILHDAPAELVDEVRRAYPALPIVAFLWGVGPAPETGIRFARSGLDRFSCVVAQPRDASAAAWMVTRETEPQQLGTTDAVAVAVAEYLERMLR
jgi:phosphopantothenoylcysteine decarboxylase/phosphopantothenate--cysteine ligase